jgi:hypothetical protein
MVARRCLDRMMPNRNPVTNHMQMLTEAHRLPYGSNLQPVRSKGTGSARKYRRGNVRFGPQIYSAFTLVLLRSSVNRLFINFEQVRYKRVEGHHGALRQTAMPTAAARFRGRSTFPSGVSFPSARRVANRNPGHIRRRNAESNPWASTRESERIEVLLRCRLEIPNPAAWTFSRPPPAPGTCRRWYFARP